MAKSIQLKNSNNENIYPYALLKEFVLYTSGGNAGNITLNDNVHNYKYIEVHYICDGIRNSKKIAVSSTEFKFSIDNIFVGSNNFIYLYSSTYKVNNATITFLNARNDFINTNSEVHSYGTNAYVNIYKVVGYK